MANEKQPETGKRVWVNPNVASPPSRAAVTEPRPAGNPGQRKPRQWNDKGFKPFRLEVLTPVHIGSGDTLSPLEYVLRQHEDSWRLYRLDMRAWFEEYGQDSAVLNAVESADLKRIQRVVNEKTGPKAEDAERFALFSCRIADSSLAKTLQDALDRKSGKKGEVSAILRNPADGSVCLPGSSLKGALSTPLINWRDKEQSGDQQGGYLREAFTQGGSPQDQQREYRNRMEKMFGDIRSYAMQALKVSDLLAPPDICAIVKAEEKRLKESAKESTPKNACEVIPAGTTLYGRLLFDGASGKPLVQGPNWELDFDELRDLCNDFYGKRFQDELTKFYTLPHLNRVKAALRPVRDKLDALNSENPPLLLRVGHYSHVESVTVDANAPKGRTFTKKDGSKTSPIFATTRTLANGELPFGWVLLHFCTPEEYAEAILQAEVDIENAAAERRDRVREAEECRERQRQEAEKLKAEAEAKRMEAERRKAEADAARKAEEERKQREKAERKAEAKRQQQEETERLARLSPEQREIAMLEKPGTTDNAALEVYEKLDAMDPVLRLEAAQALKKFWEKSGKWKAKKLKQQQQTRVEKVKALLLQN